MSVAVAGARRERVNIRTRIALAVIVLVALALGFVGVVLFAVQRASTEAGAAADLSRAMDEFETLATQGVDPQTGRRFADPSRLLEVALQRTALGPAEGELGVVAGQPRWSAPEAVEFRPEDDDELMAVILPLTQLDVESTGQLRTGITNYRYAVMPVFFEDTSERGALVRVVDLRAAQAPVNEVMRVYAVVAFGSILLVAAVTWVFAGRLLRPIKWLRETAAAVSADDLSARVPVTGSDDLTGLTLTMNGMLDRVEASVEAQRRLLDDVGHELRTPVTVVRGHLELMDPKDPADIATTQALALDELSRMGGLVTDLLTLAKSGGADFVQPKWTDVALLTDSTLEKARALGEHRWRLGALAEVSSWLDPTRVTQAWLQLAANAAKYSEPGTPIEFGSEARRNELRLWVGDQGIGIAPDELDLIVSRFGRTRAGRAYTSDGAGLGLSIVSSIVQAHGGRLDIASEPGAGSTFTMVLPLTPDRKDLDEHDPDH